LHIYAEILHIFERVFQKTRKKQHFCRFYIFGYPSLILRLSFGIGSVLHKK